MTSLTIALAQINPTVGDLAGNAAKIRAAARDAAAQGATLVIFSEMVLTGYPPEDLVYRANFQDAAMAAAERLARDPDIANGPALVIGGLWREAGKLYNTALLLDGGKIAHRQYKYALPNYGVFDEKRVFAAGPLPAPVRCRGVNLGLMICEDMWTPDVAARHVETGADLLVVLNASPYELDKPGMRHAHAGARVEETGLPLIYVNQVGGQDELVFDGSSFVLDADGTEVVRLQDFVERLHIVTKATHIESKCDETESVYQAMVLGLRDYVNKNGFAGVVLGLSGGIDSALTAAVAVDALGAGRVRAVMMPSRYTAKESVEDAVECAHLLGIPLDSIPIEPAMAAFDTTLAEVFSGQQKDTTEENIQARIRGIILMAMSNKFGLMLLTTGNKSEMSVGYATLYGDMAGGFSVLKDVYKMRVYALAKWRNASEKGAAIPERTITRAPTAELRANQLDQDSLPPYAVLDAILERLIEREMAAEAIVKEGFDAATVARVSRMLFAAEYKRRQAPPGVKITSMAFGRDRRYPLTNGFGGK